MSDPRKNSPALNGPRVECPYLDLLHLPAMTVQDDQARMEFEIEKIHLRHGGVVHGGFLASVLDTVTGGLAYSVAPPGADVVTVQLNLNMTASAKLGDRVVATAKVLHSGRRTAVIHGEIRRSDDKLIATGSATIYFLAEGLAKQSSASAS